MFKHMIKKSGFVSAILFVALSANAESWEKALQDMTFNESQITSVQVEKQLQAFSNSILTATDPIETEREDRNAADRVLSNRISNNEEAIETEREDRNAADRVLSNRISNNEEAIGDLNFKNTRYIPSDTKDLSTAIRSLDANLARANYRMDELDNKIEKHHKEMKRGFASLAAMTRLVPNERSKSDTQLAFGIGHYRGTTGFAVGAFHYIDNNTLVNAGVGYAGHGSATFGVGITFGF